MHVLIEKQTWHDKLSWQTYSSCNGPQKCDILFFSTYIIYPNNFQMLLLFSTKPIIIPMLLKVIRTSKNKLKKLQIRPRLGDTPLIAPWKQCQSQDSRGSPTNFQCSCSGGHITTQPCHKVEYRLPVLPGDTLTVLRYRTPVTSILVTICSIAFKESDRGPLWLDRGILDSICYVRYRHWKCIWRRNVFYHVSFDENHRMGVNRSLMRSGDAFSNGMSVKRKTSYFKLFVPAAQ